MYVQYEIYRMFPVLLCPTTALFLEEWVVPPHPNLQVHHYLLLTIF